MKNPLYYVDYWYDLIKFGFDRKHTFITLIVVCVSFIAPILFLYSYSIVPSTQSIRDPFVFSGTIKELKRHKGHYRTKANCVVSIQNNNKIITRRFVDVKISEGTYICDIFFKEYVFNRCIIINMSDFVLNKLSRCDDGLVLFKDTTNMSYLYKGRKTSVIAGIILVLIAFIFTFKLHIEYKKSKLKD